MKALTRRSLMLAAGMLACAAIPTARAAKKREWPALPEVPADLNAERLFVELAENGEGVRFESRKGAPVVNMVFDPQCQWCVWEFEQFRPFMDRVTFVWHPVAVLNPWSELQGAAIPFCFLEWNAENFTVPVSCASDENCSRLIQIELIDRS